MMSFEITFSARRKMLGYTQHDVATKLGISSATVCMIEKGEFSFHRDRYVRLLDTLTRERLRELVRELPNDACSFLGELFEKRKYGATEHGNGDSSPALTVA